MADFRTLSLRKYSVIILYLFPEALEQIKHQLMRECGPETIIVSVGFLIKGFSISETFRGRSGLCAYKYTHISSSNKSIDDCKSGAHDSEAGLIQAS